MSRLLILTQERVEEILDAVEMYVAEVNDHMQDEQGDWDGRPCEDARRLVYSLLGRIPESSLWR